MVKKSAVLIAGPTASGKSNFAIALAEKINGIIINADAMQVYKDLHVLTARPSQTNIAKFPHRLYGHVSASVRYSVGTWIQDIETVLRETVQNKKVPIIVGGTGLYFKILTEGFTHIPTIVQTEQDTFLAQYQGIPTQKLYEKLNKLDSKSANHVRPSDRQRILRALLVLNFTGQSLIDWRNQKPDQALLAFDNTLPLLLMPSHRQWLYQRINNRVDKMIKSGIEIEIKNLTEQNIGNHLPIMKALGVRHFQQCFINGKLSIEEAVLKTQRDTRRYAKRQMTWQRNQMKNWSLLDPVALQKKDNTVLEINKFIKEFKI